MDRKHEQLLLPIVEPTHAPHTGSLLISRRPGEFVQIGNIRVRVIRGGAEPVLAIQAPPDVPIARGELLNKVGLAEEYEREIARRQRRRRRQQPEGRLTHLPRAA